MSSLSFYSMLMPSSTIQLPTQFSSSFTSKFPFSKPYSQFHIRIPTKLYVSSSTNKILTSNSSKEETVFFDGGSHYGDLITNLLLGFTLFWLPLTFAAISRAFFLRFRFTNFRVTVISGLTGQDRSDFPYNMIKDVKSVPRFIGEWGDVVITLKDGTKVDLKSVPRFREVAQYCLAMSGQKYAVEEGSRSKGFLDVI